MSAEWTRGSAWTKFREVTGEVLEVNLERVLRDATFSEDLESDSLDVIELSMAIEEAFDISIKDDELKKIHTPGDAFDLLVQKLNLPPDAT